jgi:hypothetical protein
MTLYPLGETPLDELFALTEAAVNRFAPEFGVACNVRGVELRPRGVDKGRGARRIAELLEIPLGAMPDVRHAVMHVARAPFGAGLLEIVALVEAHNRPQTLTET